MVCLDIIKYHLVLHISRHINIIIKGKKIHVSQLSAVDNNNQVEGDKCMRVNHNNPVSVSDAVG